LIIETISFRIWLSVMALREIKIYPDSVLRQNSKFVEKITDEIISLSGDMVETMLAANGAGLAAIQVGVPVKLIVIDEHLSDKKKPIVLINPEIIRAESEETIEEGCLSVPKFYEFVKRAKRVVIKAMDLKEKEIGLDCEGQLARALQHEIDHLNGILFIDYLSPIKREFFKKKFMRRKR
jgi:peptide deformylase